MWNDCTLYFYRRERVREREQTLHRERQTFSQHFQPYCLASGACYLKKKKTLHYRILHYRCTVVVCPGMKTLSSHYVHKINVEERMYVILIDLSMF